MGAGLTHFRASCGEGAPAPDGASAFAAAPGGLQLVKTAELDPTHNYLFGFHPHGVLVAGAFGNFCTEATGFQRLFPGLTPHLLMLPFWFKVPFFRDYIMSGGLVSSEKASASYLLNHESGGQVAVVAVGGPPESLDARPGALTLRILGRKGFVKMALQHGAALVPVFSFGENELFNQVSNPQGSFIRAAQERLQKAVGLALPLFHARGVFQYSFGLLPFRRPIYTVVGAPIPVPKTPHPSREAIDHLHETYLEKLTQLFEEHKAEYGLPPEKHLSLI
ncbi:2-acylglycerol O-acyltransferase 2-A-like isoform X2 [Hemicordylus capensis]|uniref:2-acylglycerol O-acyltransferase 2-A-like isoform X2 n=1 Tax=Hemicordylus capensis TaxID=884348 RepID=UPI0023048E70|nr:2-acylglycerol O-acyltransferase 2-A-like isoform X2 [Hemicordylus capensis]